MQPVRQPLSPFEALPRDILTEIIGAVAEVSREDVRSCLLTCEELTLSADDPSIFKKMELRDLVASPLLAVNGKTDLMEKCLINDNPAANYVKGLLEYFHFDHPNEGLVYLSRAANAERPMDEAVYLYGIVNLCLRHYEIGKQYLDQLRTGRDSNTGDKCWANIKRALHGIGVPTKDVYMEALWEMMPPYVCNVNDMENTCDTCYHYKQMVKFVYTI